MDKILNPINMNYPLTDYFINSTHNTYLTGHQIHGKAKSSMYSKAVLNGYRLVELDCYNGDNDDIIITHGFTFCGEILLKEIIFQNIILMISLNCFWSIISLT